ncbi:MAG: TetR/AcrR family transcriptional regulator [Bacteroidales bacterium]|jgi:AcrR family transcriptional regulator
MNYTKEIIKTTALQLFLTRGYSVGINEIIQKSGTSKGAFYHHFASKEKLFLETVDKFFFGYLDNLDFPDTTELSFRKEIISLAKKAYAPFKAIRQLIPASEDLNYLNIIAEYPNHESLRKKNTDHFNNFIDALTRILETAVKDGIITRQVDTKSLCFHIGMLIDGSIVDGILMYNSIDKAEEACLTALEQLLDLVEN